MDENKLGVMETRFAEMIWASAPIRTGQSMSRGVWLETHNDLHHVKTPLPARYFSE